MNYQPGGAPLNAIVFPGEGWWLAVVIEHGLATYARERREIVPELLRLMRVQIGAAKQHNLHPFDDKTPAPEKYQRAWRERCRDEVQIHPIADGYEVAIYELDHAPADCTSRPAGEREGGQQE